MKKLPYNLARARQVDGRAFALRAGPLALLALLLGALAVANLAARRDQARLDREVAGPGRQKLAAMDQSASRLRREISAWKKTLGPELAVANSLITRKSFSFVARLDFLEKASNPGIRVRHIDLANDQADRISMSIAARSLKDLFALYKQLAPHELVITRETQSQDEYLVNLSFKVLNETL
jgi:hypothetical protein